MRQLKNYQEIGVEFLKARKGAGLFMDMGLGKTATTLFALKALLEKREGPVLLVGPIRVVETVWRQEAQEWPELQSLTFSLLRGTKKQRAEAAKAKVQIYLVNPELLGEALALLPQIEILVIDESSMFKNSSSIRFKTIKPKIKHFRRTYILTGTPTPNGLLNLWAQVYLIDMGARLGKSFYVYRERFFYTDDYQGFHWVPKPGAFEDITRLISDIVLRVDAATYLPPREVLHRQVCFDLPGSVAKLYAKMEKTAFVDLGLSTATAANAAIVPMKLRQIASGFIYDDDGVTKHLHDEKLKIVEEVIESTGSPVLVFYQFVEELTMLRQRFRQGVVFSSDKVAHWNRGEIPLMFLNPKSAAHGINLQHGGHTVVVYSSSYSQEEMSQAYARIDRQGQTKPVIFHHILAKGTVDELIYSVINDKSEVQRSFMDKIKEYGKKKGYYS
jgi:SNF2 family DNA or RNA helicase